MVFFVYFSGFFVCEGSLDLSILVSIIPNHGNDPFQSYSVLQCYDFFVSYIFFTLLCLFSSFWWLICSSLFLFLLCIYFSLFIFSIGIAWGISLAVI